MSLASRCVLVVMLFLQAASGLWACTGITLKSKDKGVVVARTVEWALGDAQHNKIMIVPRGKAFVGQTPEGLNGKKWVGQYGFVTVKAYVQLRLRFTSPTWWLLPMPRPTIGI